MSVNLLILSTNMTLVLGYLPCTWKIESQTCVISVFKVGIPNTNSINVICQTYECFVPGENKYVKKVFI